MSILVVDDLPDFRQLMRAVLEDAGYGDVITAESTLEAFDLVLLDINMPGSQI